MSKKKYYVVKKGKKPGIYNSWGETQEQVSGFSGAVFKGFTTLNEAKDYFYDKPESKSDHQIIIYTDGGTRNHGNVKGGHVKSDDKAAWAFLIDFNGKQISDSQGEFGATNNRMEIMGLLSALKYLLQHNLNEKNILAVLDSQYVLNAITKGWLTGWKMRGWSRSGNMPLKNKELWQQLDQVLNNFSNIHFEWTKGHSDNKGNVFVDHLLNKTMDSMNKNQLAKQSHSKQETKSKSPDLKIDSDTQKSVNDIQQSLKQLGLFDKDNQDN